MRTKQKIQLILILLVSIILIYPRIFVGENDFYFNSDGYYHFQRFLDICNQLKDGVFSPYMNYNDMLGFGYPSSLFYPDLFYYPVAALTLLNVSPILAFKIFLVTVFCASAVSMYIVLKKIAKENKKDSILGFIFPLLYAFNYFQYRHLVAGRISELLAAVFIPLVIYGIYAIIKHQKDWIYLVIGMTGLVYSHILSAVVLFITIILFYIINYKIMFKKPYILVVTIKSGIISLLLCAKQIFPMIEMMMQDKYMYTKSFFKFPEFNEMTQQIVPEYIPYVFIVILVIFLLLINRLKIEYKMIGLGILLWLTNTNLFDWTVVEPYCKQIMTIIQMPRRLFVPVIPLLLIAIFIIYTNKNKNNLILVFKTLFKFAFVFLLFINVAIFMYAPGITDNGHNSYNENIENFNNGIYLGGYDYLSTSFSLNEINEETDDFHLKIYELFRNIKEETGIELKQNKNIYTIELYGNDEYIDVPILYYKGYVAKTDLGELEIEKSDNGLLSIFAPIGKNTVTIYYEGTDIQKISLYISLFGFVVLFIFMIIDKSHKSKTVFRDSVVFLQNTEPKKS